MAKTNEEILEAVRGLDPQNDEHWTADGQPRLDAVENMLGADVSRKLVTNAAPDFTRAVALSLVDAPEDGEPPADEPPVDGSKDASAEDKSVEPEAVPSSPEPTTKTDTASEAEAEPDEDDPLAEGPADVEAEMDQAIQEVQEAIASIQQELVIGKNMLAEAEAALARLVDEKNRMFPPMTQAEAIQQFQRNEQAKRAAARGVGLTSSPIDAALGARRKVRRQGAPD